MASLRTIGFVLIVVTLLYSVFPLSSSRSILSSSASSRGSTLQPHLVIQESRNDINPVSVPERQRKRFVAIGDIHGDLPHLLRILRFSKLVDSQGRWHGGEDQLVQTGDIVDRGTDTIQLYRYFMKLRDDARMAGGDVHNLLGNHEIMNAMGDWRYVTNEDVKTFGGDSNRRYAMSTKGWIGQEWAANYSITARLPYFSSSLPSLSHSAIAFVHGGILPSYLDSIASSQFLSQMGLGDSSPIAKINAIGSEFMKILDPSQNDRSKWSTEQKQFWSAEGPMWDRTSATLSDEVEVCRLIQLTLEKLNAKRIIMGHTPHFESMISRCNGQILLIVTGISRAYGGVLSALEIIVELDKIGGRNQRIESEIVTALYEDSSVILAKTERIIEWIDLSH